MMSLGITCFPLLPFLSSVNIPLTWALFSYSMWQQYSCSQNTPETRSPCTYFSPFCIKALIIDFPGKGGQELPLYLTSEVNAARCQPRVWEHWWDQQQCPRAAGGYTPKCLTLKKLWKVSVPALLIPRVCTWCSKGPVRGQIWGRRWELCSELSSTYGQSRALPQCLGLVTWCLLLL